MVLEVHESVSIPKMTQTEPEFCGRRSARHYKECTPKAVAGLRGRPLWNILAKEVRAETSIQVGEGQSTEED